MSGIPKPNARAGRAARLAARVERICFAGIELRARGACADPRGGPGCTPDAHAHDRGCRALGVPMRRLTSAVRAWDAVGAAGLVCEALDEAVRDIESFGGAWDAGFARDALAYALRRRITPSQAPSQTHAPSPSHDCGNDVGRGRR